MLGGIEIPHDQQLIGHSDADVLLHAVTDAILGAAALGDIGEIFPDTDSQNRDRDSADMLQIAVQHMADAGFRVVNIDCVVHAQRPKLLPHRDAIRRRIAKIVDIPVDCVGLKAKTGELVGVVGREEAICARCVTLLEKS